MKLLGPLVIIILCVGLYYVYLQPTYASILEIQQQKANYEDILQKAKELADHRDAMLSAYNSIPPEDIDRLKKVIPEKVDSVALAANINSMASRYGMAISKVKLLDPQLQSREGITQQSATEPYRTTIVVFTVKGQYEQFIQFLRELESNINLVDVYKLNVSASQKTDSKSQAEVPLEYTLEVHTYSLR